MVLTPVHLQHVILRHRVNNVPFSNYGEMAFPLKNPIEASSLPWYDFEQLGLVVMTFNDKLGQVHEAMVDKKKILLAKHFMTQPKICPYTGQAIPFYKYCQSSPFSNENIRQLNEALTNPNESSYPIKLRTIDTIQVHKRINKPIQLAELQNWLESGYNMGTILFTAFKVEYIKMKSSICVFDLFEKIQKYIKECIENNDNKDTNNIDIDNNSIKHTEQEKEVIVSATDIVQYAIKQKWTSGEKKSTESGHMHEEEIKNAKMDELNIEEMLFNVCEELELLSREYSSEEGEDSSVACGTRIEVETEHPDYIIKKGIEESTLKRIPFTDPDWDNPLPEHTPGYLQKAFPFVFLSGHGCPYEDRPRDIKMTISSWETYYMDWVSKQPAAEECPRLQFLLHGRAQRIAGRKQVQVAIMNVGIDKNNLPTKQGLIDDSAKRERERERVLLTKFSV